MNLISLGKVKSPPFIQLCEKVEEVPRELKTCNKQSDQLIL